MTLRFLKMGVLVVVGATAACTGTVSDPGSEHGTGGSTVGSGTGGNTPGSGGSKPGGTGASSATGGSQGTPGSGGSVDTTGSGGAGTMPTVPAKLNLTGAPHYFRYVRLTNEQWANSVRDLLALSAPSDLAANFQSAVSGTTDFVNNENVLSIDQRGWGDFQLASETLAAQVTATDAALAKVYSGTDPAAFITAFGRRAYRRPLTAAEKTTYMTLYSSGASLTGTRSAFAKGASLVIRAMLQSPFFLYRSELGTTGQPLNAYEMAAKLSLWLRGTTPNDALLDAAAGPGKLDTADGATALAKTMVDEAAVAPVMRKFHGQFLHLDLFSTLTKSGVPSFDPAIATELVEASYLFFDKIFSSGQGVKDIFLSTKGFVGPKMAGVYGSGVTAPASGFMEQALGANRVGFFTQLPYLMYWARNGDPDSIHRGVTLNRDVLCATLGAPALAVPMLLPKLAGETNRVNVDKTTSGCGTACHNEMINPLGFAFEHYDGMGQYRQTEKDINQKDLAIDSSGTYTFTDGQKTYADAPELMQIMATSEQSHLCYAKELASFGLQRDVIESDMPLLTSLAGTSMASSGSVKQIMIDLVKQNAFRTRFGGAQ